MGLLWLAMELLLVRDGIANWPAIELRLARTCLRQNAYTKKRVNPKIDSLLHSDCMCIGALALG